MSGKKFRGRSTNTLDSKGRLNIPARIRTVMDLYETEELVLVPWFDHIRAYPPEVWDSVEDKLMDEGPEHDLGEFAQLLVSGAEECLIDKQGRILLRPSIRVDASIEGKEVVVSGAKDWFVIEDKVRYDAKWAAMKDSLSEKKEQLKKLNMF